MLTTTEALQAVLDSTVAFPGETIPLAAATSRILRQSVVAERDQPPFDRVMMDGIAIAASDIVAQQRQFRVQAMQAAGDPVLTLKQGQCIEIMTGAARPVNADCIVPVERVAINEDVASVEADYDAVAGRFIHTRGSDFKIGTELLGIGKRISPMDIAIIASCGLTSVQVAADPVMRVISTGNELVPAGQTIGDHQIRLSNGPALIALLEEHGFKRSSHEHIVDDVDAMRARLAMHLEQASVLVLSGGVSMGKADYVPEVLADLGVEVIFHKVSQRPGKPMWFGRGAGGQLVFALPGNPVSALVCCRQYVVPALQKASGLAASPPAFAALASDLTFSPDLTCFQPVKLVSNAAGQVLAMPVKTNTSGDFAALSQTDGYVELPRDKSAFVAGTPLILQRWITA